MIGTAKTAHICSVCGQGLHGLPETKSSAKVHRLSKSARRPTALFGGALCSKCRTFAVEEYAKVLSGNKIINEVDLKLKPFVAQLEKRSR